ncbi:MAG: hypothetical protein GF353_06695, partial [Candidatus Lokiarchaeota archaeon]|nr:hypothetical protein [Candidatus Lokiarchaeota archaeon]
YYIECLEGIEDFSHVVVLFWTHKTPEKGRQIKKVHPAGLETMPIKGYLRHDPPLGLIQ